MDFSNPNAPWLNSGYGPFKKMCEEQRQLVSFLQGLVFLVGMLALLAVCSLLSGCTVPKAVEEYHHHHYEVDTAAVSRQIDGRLIEWHTRTEAFFRERLEQFMSQQQQSEHQQETVTETITETVDSLGRKIRQEQRTISRDITRELLSVEQAITREYESRLHCTVDSLDSAWQERYDSLQAHVVKMDSAMVKKTPVGDARPWYRRAWDAIAYILIGACVACVIWFTRKWWIRLL